VSLLARSEHKEKTIPLTSQLWEEPRPGWTVASETGCAAATARTGSVDGLAAGIWGWKEQRTGGEPPAIGRLPAGTAAERPRKVRRNGVTSERARKVRPYGVASEWTWAWGSRRGFPDGSIGGGVNRRQMRARTTGFQVPSVLCNFCKILPHKLHSKKREMQAIVW